MALIGHLSQFEGFFARYPTLENVVAYLQECMKSSPVRSRILALGTQGDTINEIAFNQNFRIEMRYDLGNGISAIEQTYALKSPKEAFFETHRKYVDLQFCVDGGEYMLIGHRGDFEVLETYDEGKDLIVYKNPLANCAFEPYSADFPIHRISLHAGILAIFFPDDVHAGGLDSVNSKLNNPKKSVLKVPVELFH
ncbi:YhcH/YjgK/YiaL family protein [Helicobacter himalayensis]|uniref:YhcH/YjgK/YiaL family protein n=1 Tax=Helicobacter himalayensis TaxID=1591088 RepID=UPI00082C82F2|nr:YhcH/YjgK/YiaL family protein [Helicobacter himalayensis]